MLSNQSQGRIEFEFESLTLRGLDTGKYVMFYFSNLNPQKNNKPK